MQYSLNEIHQIFALCLCGSGDGTENEHYQDRGPIAIIRLRLRALRV